MGLTSPQRRLLFEMDLESTKSDRRYRQNPDFQSAVKHYLNQIRVGEIDPSVARMAANTGVSHAADALGVKPIETAAELIDKIFYGDYTEATKIILNHIEHSNPPWLDHISQEIDEMDHGYDDVLYYRDLLDYHNKIDKNNPKQAEFIDKMSRKAKTEIWNALTSIIHKVGMDRIMKIIQPWLMNRTDRQVKTRKYANIKARNPKNMHFIRK